MLLLFGIEFIDQARCVLSSVCCSTCTYSAMIRGAVIAVHVSYKGGYVGVVVHRSCRIISYVYVKFLI